MKRTTLISAAVILALVVDIYVRLRSPSAPPHRQVQLAASPSIDELRPPVRPTPAPEPQFEREPEIESVKLMASRLEEPAPTNEIGMITRLSSLDFQRYLVFMNAGLWAERKNPEMWKIKEMYSLTDEELKAVTDYAATAIRSDRQFQSAAKQRLCSRRAELQTAASLGQALNEFDRAVELHRETLARQSEGAVGSVTYAKLNSQLLSWPASEVRYADFPVLFQAQDRDLKLELTHLCDRKWRE